MCAAACTAKAPADITIIPAPPAARSAGSEWTATYQEALGEILQAFEEVIGLPRVEVPLVMFPSRRSFEGGLLQIGYPPALARTASAFDAIGGARAILVNAGVVNRFDRTRRVRLLAHELVHTVQYEFGGGTRGASEQWLREGFAEWVACRVTAHLGLGSFDASREELLRSLAGAPFGLQPAPLDRLVTFPQWVEAQRRYDVPVYAQAFIATELLLELRGVAAVVAYFRLFRTSTDHEAAFTEAFGMDRAAFERAFTRRWHETVARFRLRE